MTEDPVIENDHYSKNYKLRQQYSAYEQRPKFKFGGISCDADKMEVTNFFKESGTNEDD